MNALIYWTVPDKTFDAPSPSCGDVAQFSTGKWPALCSIEPNGVLTARLICGQRAEWVTMPEHMVTPETVRVLTFLPPWDEGGGPAAVVALPDGRVMDVGLFNLRMLPGGA